MNRRLIAAIIAASGSVAAAQPQRLKPILGGAQEDITWAPVVVCFAQGTDPLYQRRVKAWVAQRNAQRFGSASSRKRPPLE